MASKALMSSVSPVLVSNKASPSPLSVGLVGPRNLSFSFSSPPTSKKPSSTLAMVVRAQQQQPGQGSGHLGTNPTPAVPVRAPFTVTEDNQWFKVRLDMPGVGVEDVDVKVEGELLVIKDLGRQLYSPYDTKVQLPPYCIKQNISATLENGVLQVLVPKVIVTTPPVVHYPVIHVPIKRAPAI